MFNLVAGSGPWIFPNFLGPGANFLKNHKIKNTRSSLIWSKAIKKIQKNQKKWDFLFFDDFRGRWTRRLGINHFVKKVYLRLQDDTKSLKVPTFSWDDHRFLFLRTWKTHFSFFSFQCNFALKKMFKNTKIQRNSSNGSKLKAK